MVSLLKQLLQQKGKKPDNFKGLLDQLQAKPGFFFNGGLGEHFSSIASFLDIQTDTIKDLKDSAGLLKHALAIETTNKASAYQAALCFALVAVYSQNIAEQVAAYNQLIGFFQQKGRLEDLELAENCEAQIIIQPPTAIFTTGERILWAFNCKAQTEDAEAALQHEEQRQQAIATEFPLSTSLLRNASYCLGIEVNTDMITNAEIANQAFQALQLPAQTDAAYTTRLDKLKQNAARSLQQLQVYAKLLNLGKGERSELAQYLVQIRVVAKRENTADVLYELRSRLELRLQEIQALEKANANADYRTAISERLADLNTALLAELKQQAIQILTQHYAPTLAQLMTQARGATAQLLTRATQKIPDDDLIAQAALLRDLNAHCETRAQIKRALPPPQSPVIPLLTGILPKDYADFGEAADTNFIALLRKKEELSRQLQQRIATRVDDLSRLIAELQSTPDLPTISSLSFRDARAHIDLREKTQGNIAAALGWASQTASNEQLLAMANAHLTTTHTTNTPKLAALQGELVQLSTQFDQSLAQFKQELIDTQLRAAQDLIDQKAKTTLLSVNSHLSFTTTPTSRNFASVSITSTEPSTQLQGIQSQIGTLTQDQAALDQLAKALQESMDALTSLLPPTSASPQKALASKIKALEEAKASIAPLSQRIAAALQKLHEEKAARSKIIAGQTAYRSAQKQLQATDALITRYEQSDKDLQTAMPDTKELTSCQQNNAAQLQTLNTAISDADQLGATTLKDALEKLRQDLQSKNDAVKRAADSTLQNRQTYAALTARFYEERNRYQKSICPKPHQERRDSITHVESEITRLADDKSITTAARLTELGKKLLEEEAATHQSHQRIGFWKKRPSRLQHLYGHLVMDYQSDVSQCAGDQQTRFTQFYQPR